jgi:hypothetical protein
VQGIGIGACALAQHVVAETCLSACGRLSPHPSLLKWSAQHNRGPVIASARLWLPAGADFANNGVSLPDPPAGKTFRQTNALDDSRPGFCRLNCRKSVSRNSWSAVRRWRFHRARAVFLARRIRGCSSALEIGYFEQVSMAQNGGGLSRTVAPRVGQLGSSGPSPARLQDPAAVDTTSASAGKERANAGTGGNGTHESSLRMISADCVWP